MAEWPPWLPSSKCHKTPGHVHGLGADCEDSLQEHSMQEMFWAADLSEAVVLYGPGPKAELDVA